MGIVKIGHLGALRKDRDRQSSRPSTINGLVHEERLLATRDVDDDDVGSSDHAEVGCELAMFGDQTCSIPYDLYDLSDLKDILSLQTWNSCLTEVERFSLAAYLPDMDQEAFLLTITELLSGDNLFFGNPLEKLFCRLQSGFYSIRVTPVREGLQFLQKRGHYHSIRLYHESLTQRFVDMGKAWSNCTSSTTIEERVRIWNKKKDQKPVLLVDLNAIPAEEDNLNKVDKKVENFQLLKKAKYMDEGRKPHTPAIDLNSVAMNTKPKGKGVLKVRAMETNSTLTHRMQTLPSDSWEPSKRAPKGVLKIKPKSNQLGQPERPITVPIPLANSSACQLGIHASKFSSPILFSDWHEETDSDEDAKRSLEQPEPFRDQQRGEVLNSGVGSFSDSHSFPRKIKAPPSKRFHNASELQEESFALKNSQRSWIQSDEAGGTGGCRNGGNIWQNSSQQNRVLCATSSNSDTFSSQNQQMLTPVHHTVTRGREIASISTAGTLPQYLDYKEQIDGGLSTTSDSLVASGVEREIIFPITYKRKKAYTKLNTVESVKQPSMVANLESVMANNAECNLVGKTKTVKIKVKGWNKQAAQFKRGLLNGLQHGSPST